MVFTRKGRAPDVDEAIARAKSLHEELGAMMALQNGIALWRAEAIRQALDKGASLRELAQALGVSIEGVRKMKGAGPPSA
jgi:hypothetical protein